jgi:hypothetical protein
MKLETSIRNALLVAARIKKCNGLIGTPEASHEALRITRAWLFGSTVKGKLNPNDTDILLESIEVGRFNLRNAKKRPISTMRTGVRYCIRSHEVAYSYLRSRIKMVRFHDIAIDGSLSDVAQTKIMIYPRNDLPKLYGQI